MGKYQDLFSRSITDPKGFWAEAAGAIGWHRKWDQVLDESKAPFYRWYQGGELNACWNALDRHVEEGRADQVALIYDSPVTNTIEKFTYRELLEQVLRFAGGLKSLGLNKGGCGHHLHAHDPAGGGGHACLRPGGRCPLRGVRRVRAPRACDLDRRCQTQAHHLRFRRCRGQAADRVQTHAPQIHYITEVSL